MKVSQTWAIFPNLMTFYNVMYSCRLNIKLFQNTECTCDARGRHSCTCLDNDTSIQCSAPNGIVWFDEECNKRCVPEPGTCNSYNDPHYRSFDGTYFDFHGECTYQAASCDDFKVGGKTTNSINLLMQWYLPQLSMQEIGGSIPRSTNPRSLEAEECAKGICLCNLLWSTQPNDRETVIEG